MKKFNLDYLRVLINLIAIIAAFVVNVLANIIPINDLTIGEISNTFFKQVLIIPANYAFAIWGLIYIGLISLGIYQVLPQQRDNTHLQKMGYWLAMSSGAQIIWVVVFQLRLFTLSLVNMLAILIPLIILYQRLEIASKKATGQTKWLVNYPISLYLGWISVATIVNFALTFHSWGWEGGVITPRLWTVIMITIATIIAVFRDANIVFKTVIIWALIAIAVRNQNDYLIAGFAVIYALLLLGLIVFQRYQPSRSI